VRAFSLLLVGACACAPTPTPVDDGGCPNDLPQSCPAAVPSYAQDVAPLFASRCQTCHTPGGEAASVSLADHDTVARQQSEVLHQVFSCAMPVPGEARALSAGERQVLLTWLVCHAPNN